MKRLDRYILKKFLSTFFFAILIFAAISVVIDYSEKVDAFVKHDVPANEILAYFSNFVPHIVALLFPLFLFIATIFFTSRMAYKSEIIAVLASGTSFTRFLRPYIIGGFLLCGFFLVANHLLLPRANYNRIAFEDTYINYVPTAADNNVHLRLSEDLFVFMQSYDYKSNMGYRFTAEYIDGTMLKKKIMADRASFDSVQQQWHLYNVTIRTNDSIQENLAFEGEVTKPFKELPFTPKDLEEDEAIKDALTTPQLNRYIKRERLRGRENLNFFLVERYRRTAVPFAGFILIIIGACIASRKVRGGSGLHLAIGIALSALYIMSLQFSTTLATKADLNPLLAVWLPNILFGIIAYYLYRKQIT